MRLFHYYWFDITTMTFTVTVHHCNIKKWSDTAECHYYDHDMNSQPIFTRSVSSRNSGTVVTETTLALGSELLKWLDGNFNAEYVIKDGQALAKEYLSYYAEEESLPQHAKYGQNTFHADLEELWLNADSDGRMCADVSTLTM